MDKSNIELLADFFKESKGDLSPNSVDIAKFIVLNAETKSLGPGKLGTGGNRPSLMGRIFDILSRPNYAVANSIKALNKGDFNVTDDFISGLAGTQKTTFQDVLKEMGMPAGPGRAILGLGLDIFADPTTYIPVAGIASKLKSVSKAKDASKVADTSLAQELLSRGEPVNPEAFGLPAREAGAVPAAFRRVSVPSKSVLPTVPFETSKKFTTSQPTLPGFEERLRLPDIINDVAASPVGKSKGQLSFRLKLPKADNIVEGVAKSDVPSTIRVTPMPKPTVEPGYQRLSQEILDSWSPTKLSSPLNKKYPETLNAKQQVDLYYRALEVARRQYKNPDAAINDVIDDAYKIYIAAEDYLEVMGMVPRIGTGENVRLSDVIQHLGGAHRAKDVLSEFSSTIKEGSPTWQAVQSLRAAGAIDESLSIKSIVSSVDESKKAADASGQLSNVQLRDFDKLLKKFAGSTARADNLSPAGVQATQKLVDFTLRNTKTEADIVLEAKSKILDEIISKGRVRQTEINSAITRALESDLGTIPKWAHNDNKGVEFLMGRVATWWGQKDLRPLSLNAIGAASATAAARGKALDNLFMSYTIPQRQEAFRLAQGFGLPSSPEVAQLGVKIRQTIDNLAGRVGATSTLMRSSVDMKMLNKWMRRYKVGFEFTRGKGKDLLGNALDFSKGSDWLDSWKIANPGDDPKVFLFKLQQAIEQATREKALFDEIGERFGSAVSGKGYQTRVSGYPYLEGYYFTEDIAKQIPRVVKDWSVETWHSGNPLLKQYDRVLSMWKSGVTIYRPAHHIRNLIGDIYLGWMDGVNRLRPYSLAVQVLKSQRGAYPDLIDVDRLVQLGLMSKDLGTPLPNKILFKNKSGIGFSAEQIYAVAHQKGLLEHARSIEDIIDLGEQSKFKPFGGKVQGAARTVSELQSHGARLAHFIDKIIKSRGDNLPEIFEQASRRARKWHPTGLDLTDFEKKYLRRVIPFYSWIRKSTPLLIEGLVMNPGKAVIPSKIFEAIQESQGIETPGRHDPFPVDQMFPEWIRGQGVGPISLPDGFLGSLSNQQPPGYVMGGVGLNPLSSLVEQLENPGRTAVTSLTPAIQVPIELSTGKKLFTGEPITGPEARPGAFGQYVGEQVPIYSALQGITGITPFGGETKKSAQSGGDASKEALINWLTSAGIKGTGPYIDQARYERTAPARMRRKISKEQLMEELRSLGNT